MHVYCRSLRKSVILNIFSYIIGDTADYKRNRLVYYDVIQLMLVSKYWLKLVIYDVLKVNNKNKLI